jgi:hypothetical protein
MFFAFQFTKFREPASGRWKPHLVGWVGSIAGEWDNIATV